jgi:hypothetical protein
MNIQMNKPHDIGIRDKRFFYTIKGPWTQEVSKHLKKIQIKGNKGIYKGGEGGVHHNKNDDHCKKQ